MGVDLALRRLRKANATLEFGPDSVGITAGVVLPQFAVISSLDYGIDLVFDKPRDDNNTDLSFGSSVEPPPPDSVVVTGSIVLQQTSVSSNLSYSVNVWRGLISQTSLPYDQAVRHRRRMLAPSPRLVQRRVAVAERWQPAQTYKVRHVSLWEIPAKTRGGGHVVWQSAIVRRTRRESIWQYPDPRRKVNVIVWGDGTPVRKDLLSGFTYPPRRRSECGSVYDSASPRESSLLIIWQQGRVLRLETVIPWGEAVRPTTVWPRPQRPVIPPEPGPCLDPDRTSLDFTKYRQDGATDLPFSCWIASTVPQRTIPIRRVYIVIHDIEITRIPDNIPIDASTVSISLDADSWSWNWQATLIGKPALDAVQPDINGMPATLSVSINGHTWHLLVEDWTENREFGSRSITARGRGLSALLSAPYQLPSSSIVNGSDMTIQQAMNALLPIGEGFSINWAAGLDDWLLPTGAWSYANQTAIQAIHDAAQQVGMVVVPAKAAKALTLQARYPVLPWDFGTATPNLIVPEAAILSMARRSTTSDQANAVYVHGGETGGVFAQVRRYLSAADRVAATHSSNLITHADATRLIGGRLLARHHTQPSVRSITMPLGGAHALGEIGQLMQINLSAGAEHGIINAVGIQAEMSDKISVRQTLTIGEDTPNEWAKFKYLLPKEPTLVGQIAVVHMDDTVTLNMVGGGTQRVRGTGALGDYHYVRAQTLEGKAPVFGVPTVIDV